MLCLQLKKYFLCLPTPVILTNTSERQFLLAIYLGKLKKNDTPNIQSWPNVCKIFYNV